MDELRALMGVETQKSYDVWAQLRKRVLDPAVEAINDYGTVSVKMTPEKLGRSVHAVRFDWRWKDPHEATETARENERHSGTRRKSQATDDAPPMIEDEQQAEPALTWWGKLTDTERETWANTVGRTFEAGGRTIQRREADVARAAFDHATGGTGAIERNAPP